MAQRSYDQPCSLACALDRVGDRWAPLVIRELTLGPLRFSDLARDVGAAPTDVLTKRLRDLERDGIVRRRELPPPTSATVYELTELGRELERPLLALARWGLNFQPASDAARLTPGMLPQALRVVLQPPPDAVLTVQLESGGQAYALRVADGWIAAERGAAEHPDLTLTGAPTEIMGALAGIDDSGAEVAGDPAALEALRAMVTLPGQLLEESRTVLAPQV